MHEPDISICTAAVCEGFCLPPSMSTGRQGVASDTEGLSSFSFTREPRGGMERRWFRMPLHFSKRQYYKWDEAVVQFCKWVQVKYTRAISLKKMNFGSRVLLWKFLPYRIALQNSYREFRIMRKSAHTQIERERLKGQGNQPEKVCPSSAFLWLANS